MWGGGCEVHAAAQGVRGGVHGREREAEAVGGASQARTVEPVGPGCRPSCMGPSQELLTGAPEPVVCDHIAEGGAAVGKALVVVAGLGLHALGGVEVLKDAQHSCLCQEGRQGKVHAIVDEGLPLIGVGAQQHWHAAAPVQPALHCRHGLAGHVHAIPGGPSVQEAIQHVRQVGEQPVPHIAGGLVPGIHDALRGGCLQAGQGAAAAVEQAAEGVPIHCCLAQVLVVEARHIGLHDGLGEQAPPQASGQQQPNGHGASALPKHSDLTGIAAHCSNVGLHPLQRCHLVHEPKVPRHALPPSGQVAKGPQPVVGRDQHNALGQHQAGAAVHAKGALVGALQEGPAIEEHHDRRLHARRQHRRKDVDIEAVHGLVARHVSIVVRLRAASPPGAHVHCVIPGRAGLRGGKHVGAASGSSKGHSIEAAQATRASAQH